MQTNEWTVRREAVYTPVQVPETVQEQSVELDYVLPDYFPDFFRLLHCTADAWITEQELTDGTLHYTVKVRMHVLYCGEQGGSVQAVTQQLTYRKQLALPAELAAAEQTVFRFTAEPSYMNCRAVSHRRIDLRGAIRIRIQAAGESRREVISGAEGLHVQCRTETVRYISQILRTQKRFVLSEDFQIAESQPALLSVLRDQVVLSVTETRIVAGKLVVKGEAAVTLLYGAENSIEPLTAVFPFSQIVEQEGLSDEMPCAVTAALTDILLTPESENDGNIRLIHCDLQITLQCEAARSTEAALLRDLYSTVHPVTPETAEISLFDAPAAISETMTVKAVLNQPDTVLTKVYAAWAEPSDIRSAAAPEDAEGTLLTGTLHCCVLAADEENRLMMLEQDAPFTWTLPVPAAGQILPPVTVRNCGYTLSGPDSVTVQPELRISGSIMRQTPHRLVTEIAIDRESRLPAEEDYALRLYFGQPEESLWEIAKRYHTAPEAVREENALADDVLRSAQMLLIPNVK
ncbi:MAG: DUF3794 domain-containing protein [Oscillospiraceae bacterium]|nr:DUF3794 domain-containing protein [Oscillospiraceae bacterium]